MIDVSERDFVTIQGFLAKHVPECEVWAFGSRATWTAKEHSDLDLVIVGPNKLETRVFNSLKEAFDESALPYRVDVLDWHRISPEFKRNIEKNYVVIRKAGQKSANAWQYYKVSDFAEVVGGGTPKTGVPEYWGGEIPWITPKDLSDHNERYISYGERSITKEGLKNSAARLVPENTVLLTSRAPVGYLAIAKKPLTTNQGFRSLIIKDGFSPEFIYYLLLNNVDYLKQHASGSTFQELSGGTLKNLQFQIPALPEQKAIAKSLGDLDAMVELNQQMNKTLESMAQAIFKQWFVDFGPWGGEKPDDWKNYTLGDISALSAGGDRPKVNSEKPTSTCTIPIYSKGIDNDGLYGYTNLAKISDESVTVSARGTIGFTCLRQTPYFPIVRLISLVPDPKYLSAKYLYLWLKSINISGTGTTQQQLTVPDFKKTEILIPTPEIMKRFTIVADSMFAQITANKNENTTITAIRDSLLPKLMSGKIRIPGKD